MSFDWAQYLNVARRLAGVEASLPNEEAKSRTAISRAYFAALLSADSFLRAKNRVTGDRKRIHSYVAEKFLAGPNRGWKKVGNKLNQLKDARVRADYEDEFLGLKLSMDTALKQAKSVIEVLKGL